MSTTRPESNRVEGHYQGTSYDLSGPEGAPLVVLIHGLGLCREVFDGIMPAFEGFRVLRYDLWGHGRTAPSPLRAASLRGLSDQIVGLLDHLGEKAAHLVGFSIGGMINRRFALDHPERALSLVILNSPHDRGEEAQAAVEARAKTVRDQGAMATMDAALRRWFTPSAQSGALADQVRAWRALADPESYAGAAWTLANGVRELIAPAPSLEVPSLEVPTLVMTSEEDSGSTPAMSRAIAAQIPSALCEIVPGLKHLGLMERPEVFSGPVSRFLKSRVHSK